MGYFGGDHEERGTLLEGQSAISNSEYRYAPCNCKIGSKYENSLSRPSPSPSRHRLNKAEASGSSRAISACTPGIINTVSLCDRLYYACPKAETCLERSFSARSILKAEEIAARENTDVSYRAQNVSFLFERWIFH